MTKYNAWCDASIGLDGLASFGYVILDEEENIIKEHSEMVHFIDNINYVEYMALYNLTLKVNEMNLHNTNVYTDSLNVFNHLKGHNKMSDSYYYLYDILKEKILNIYPINKINRIESSENKAHSLCKKGVTHEMSNKSFAYRKVFCQNNRPKLYNLSKGIIKDYKREFEDNNKINYELVQRLLTRNILLAKETVISQKERHFIYTFEDMKIYTIENTIINLEKINNNFENSMVYHDNRIIKVLNRLLNLSRILAS
jgi:ribonuclease HI